MSSLAAGQRFITMDCATEIGPNLRVKLSGTTPLLCALCGLNEVGIGKTVGRAEPKGSAYQVNVELDFPTQMVTVGSSCAVHAALYSAASGKVDDVSTSAGAIIYYAAEAGSGDGAQIVAYRAATMTA